MVQILKWQLQSVFPFFLFVLKLHKLLELHLVKTSGDAKGKNPSEKTQNMCVNFKIPSQEKYK